MRGYIIPNTFRKKLKKNFNIKIGYFVVKVSLLNNLVTYVCNSCGTEYKLLSGDRLSKNFQLDICAACHPFYLGKLASESNLGPVEKLKEKFSLGRQNIK